MNKLNKEINIALKPEVFYQVQDKLIEVLNQFDGTTGLVTMLALALTKYENKDDFLITCANVWNEFKPILSDRPIKI